MTPPHWLESLRMLAESTHGDEVTIDADALLWIVDIMETVFDEDPIGDWSELLRDYYQGPPGVPNYLDPDDTTDPLEVDD